MSAEGYTLVARAGLVIYLIMTATIFRALVGSGRRRGRVMLAGTLGGVSFGVLVAYPISRWLGSDASAVCACPGMTLGWGVSWLLARHVPRQAD